MTDQNAVAVCLVIDRSGSMDLIKEDAQGAIQAFLDKQVAFTRETAKTVMVRLVQFDHEYQVVAPLTPVFALEPYVLDPRGNTALLDAMGRGITEFGAELAAMAESDRPGTVIFAVITDGHENCSTEWTRPQVMELVRRQEREYSWQVLYLGANQDAIAVGQTLGVRTGRTLTYGASSAGVRGMAASMGNYVAMAAGPMSTDAAFTDEDRKRSR
jgi:uncharacterized protein YegL